MINEEPNYWPRYTIKDHYRLRHQFSESEKIDTNWSQSMQDMFVLSMLDGKRNGVYVEIGADKPKIINNSYLLEKKFGWRGVSFELDNEKVEFFNQRRRNRCICTDATIFDYKSLFQERNYPKQIDYLSLDIDPSDATFESLKKLPLDDYRFSVITYEHENYRTIDDVWQKESIKIFEKYGYELIIKNVANMGNPYEDWWVDPKVVDRAIIDKFSKTDSWSRESTECIFSNTQFSIMPITAILEE